MRERTTWNRDSIKQAAVAKKADPYLMNQDHVGQQPPADKYLTGDPSTFAEDVHPAKDTWEAEYANGQVKRDEIGLPEMRKDTFNHPEKTAADKAVLLKKANIAIRVASMMLGKNASEQAVEDQSVSLMHLPDAELVNTFNRLAGDEPQVEAVQQQAVQQQQAQQQQQAPQGASAVQSATYQQAMDQCKQAIQAGDEQGCKQAIEAMVQAQMMQQAKDGSGTAGIEGMVQAAVKRALQAQTMQQAQPQQQQAVTNQQAQQPVQQQVAQQPVQQAPQGASAVQAQPQPQQQQAVTNAEQPVEAIQADDALLDDMLMDTPGGMSEMDIEMEAPSMDMSDAVLGPEDEVLKTLFATDDQGGQGGQEQEQAQQKQAMTRTASTRTVGTRPSGGVSRVGGGAPAGRGSDADKLSSLWASAPDVKDAFGM